MNVEINNFVNMTLDKLSQASNEMSVIITASESALAKYGDQDIIVECKEESELIYRSICDAMETIKAMQLEASAK